jgi:hypothetical protein
MTIEQTIDIPAGIPVPRLHLDIPLPKKHPVGKVRVKVELAEDANLTMQKPSASWRSLYGMCKNSGDTMEAFLERKHADKAFEDAIEERRLKERAKAKGETPIQ